MKGGTENNIIIKNDAHISSTIYGIQDEIALVCETLSNYSPSYRPQQIALVESRQLFTESRQLFTESRQLFTESRQLFTESFQLVHQVTSTVQLIRKLQFLQKNQSAMYAGK